MRTSIDFYIEVNGSTRKMTEVFVVPDDFNGKKDAVRVANIYMKQLKRGLEKNEEIVRVVFNEDDITSYIKKKKLELVK